MEPLEPGSPAWNKRCSQLLTEETKRPRRWHYLSFADDEGFLGGLVLFVHGVMEGMIVSRALGLNPGGEVMCIPVENLPPQQYLYKLLTREEVEQMDKETVRVQ
jgi:hypothetical protein